MSDYKKQADRLRILRQMPQQQQSPSLQLSYREPVQAQYHRPPANVNALVQRHYFPAEGAVPHGVGEPGTADVSNAAGTADRLSKYQSICRRRAAETSRAIKAERDAKMKQALSARERAQVAKAFGVRVALSNLKASPNSPVPRKEISHQDMGENDALLMVMRRASVLLVCWYKQRKRVFNRFLYNAEQWRHLPIWPGGATEPTLLSRTGQLKQR
ncbi:hypothetical protein Vretifemale_1634 [Volvox reticuliferus]|uniref:Uncharacterized protein n=1 Tax=Volvox reticuliferus TaxID=1737510 RepID=A0A8J4BY60_9CHLO|nr:hypothetical protein Vretifemale_1634 [Volvox reticuliferus]